jgi:hypothetical protein
MKNFGSIEVSWRWPLNNSQLEDDLFLIAEFSYTPTADGLEDIHIMDLVDSSKNEVLSEAFTKELLASVLHGKTLEEDIQENIDERWRDGKSLNASLNIVSFVKHCPGHKNSKGEAAPWCVVSHETGKILSSHKSEAEARAHLKQMEMHKHMGSALTPNEISKQAHCGPCSIQKWWVIQQLSDLYFKDKQAVDNNLVAELARVSGETASLKSFLEKFGKVLDKLKSTDHKELHQKLAQVYFDLTEIQKKLDEGVFQVVDKEDKSNTKEANSDNEQVVKEVKEDALARKMYKLNWHDLNEEQQQTVRDRIEFEKPKKEAKPKQIYSLEELESLPTLTEGHMDDLKVDDGEYRVWLSRMTKADGAPYDHRVTIEKLMDGKWTTIETYEPTRGLHKKADSVVTLPIQVSIPDNLILQYANGSIYKGKIERGEMEDDDWNGLIKDTAHWMWTVGRANDNMRQAFFSNADWHIDTEQRNKIKSMFIALPRGKGMEKKAVNIHFSNNDDSLCAPNAIGPRSKDKRMVDCPSCMTKLDLNDKKANTVPYNGTPPREMGTDPNEDPGTGEGGDRPGTWVEPKAGTKELEHGGPFLPKDKLTKILQMIYSDGLKEVKLGLTTKEDLAEEMNYLKRELYQSDTPEEAQGILEQMGLDLNKYLDILWEGHQDEMLPQLLPPTLGSKHMKSVLKQDLGTLKKGEVIVVTGSKKDKVFFFVEKNPTIIGIVSNKLIEQYDLFHKKSVILSWLKCHKVISKSSQFIKKLAVDFKPLIDPSVLDQLIDIKEDISLHKDEVMDSLNALPAVPMFTASIHLADAAQYFSLKGQIPTEQDTLNYIRASVASRAGIRQDSLTNDFIRQSLWDRKTAEVNPLDWTEKLMLLQQWAMTNKLPFDIWHGVQTLLDSKDLSIIPDGIEKLFDKASQALQKPKAAAEVNSTNTVDKEAAPPPMKPTDPLGLNEEYVFDSINNVWIKQFKTADLNTQSEYFFNKEDMGIYGDGALGHQHIRERLAYLVEPWSPDLAKELKGPMSDDASEEYDAIDELQTHTEEGLIWGFSNGDLGLFAEGEVESKLISAKEITANEVKWCPECERPNQFGELCDKCLRDDQERHTASEQEKKKLTEESETPLLDGMKEPPSMMYDKWPAQEKAVYFGFPPKGWSAYEPYKRSSKNILSTGQVWANMHQVIFIRIKQLSTNKDEAKIQTLGMNSEQRWIVNTEFFGKTNMISGDKSNYELIDENISDSDWSKIVGFAVRKQPQLSFDNSLWHQLTEQALWSPKQLKFLSPVEMEQKKDELLDKFNKKEITKDQLEQSLKSLSFLKTADFLPSMTPSFDGGFMDSPGPGLGRADTDQAKFPDNQFMPKGPNDTQHDSVNEDKNIEYFPNPGDTDKMEDSAEDQIKNKYGKAYLDAFIMLKQTISGHESVDAYIDALIEGSDFVLDKNILKELVDKYLIRRDEYASI